MQVIDFYNRQIQSSKNAIDHIDFEKVNFLVNEMLNCNGQIILTGVGKNGHVAAKATSTLRSIGLKCFYLNPVDSVHGDMGIIGDDDIIISVSKSGNTEELLAFLQNVRRKNCKIFSIHSNPNNKSLVYSDFDIELFVDHEADHLNAIPTTSITIFTIFLQSIACEISRIKKLSLEDFVYNHPGGSIGQML